MNVVHRQVHKNIQQTNHSTLLTMILYIKTGEVLFYNVQPEIKDGHGAEVTHQSLVVAVFDLIWFTFERSFKV